MQKKQPEQKNKSSHEKQGKQNNKARERKQPLCTRKHYNIFDFRQRILGNGWETVAISGQRQQFSTCCQVFILLFLHW
jgi:hypothetical protein